MTLINFHRVQCNEPTLLALDSFWCFSLISTKYAAVIVFASSYRFKCILDGPVYGCLSENAKYCFYREVHIFFQIGITVSTTSHISFKWVSTEY